MPEMISIAKDELDDLKERIRQLERVLTARDRDERKQAEKTQKESRERLITILDSLDAIVYVADMKTYEIIFVNRYVRDLFGDIEGKVCWQTLQTGQAAPCDFCTNDKIVDAGGNPSSPYAWEFRNTKTDRWYYIVDRALSWVDGRIVRLEIATDITERKKAEKALAEQSKLLESVFENTLTSLAILDKDFNFVRVNEAYARADNRDPEDFPGHNHFEFYPSEAKAFFEEVVATRKPCQAFARPFVYSDHPEREVTYWDWTLVPVLDDMDKVTLLILSLNNVTDRQKAQKALSESEVRLQEAQKISKIGNWDWDIVHNRLWWSDETYRIFGLSPQEFGATFGAFINAVHPDDRKRVDNSIQEALQKCITSWQIDYRIALSGGTVRFVHEESKTLCDHDGNPVRRVGTVQDITEYKLAEDKIRKLNEELEQRVRERTDELEEKNRELERFNKLFVGRELRMIELKEKITELEKQTGASNT